MKQQNSFILLYNVCTKHLIIKTRIYHSSVNAHNLFTLITQSTLARITVKPFTDYFCRRHITSKH